MPDFWQFPTVSMGLGPIMAIYQARFNRYLQHRGLKDTSQQQVWCFLGDGETDEPESLGALTLAVAREARQPDLRHQLQPAAARRPGARQRQDHPGTGSRLPRRRLERHQGHLGQRLGPAARHATRPACSSSAWARWSTASTRSTPSSPAPTSASTSSASIPSCCKLVEHLTDEQLQQADARRPRSGEGLRRLQGRRRAHGRADRHPGQDRSRATAWARPAKARNITHQQKKLNEEELREFRTRFGIPHLRRGGRRARRSTSRPTTARRSKYLHERRKALGGFLPARQRAAARRCKRRRLDLFEDVLQGQRRPARSRRRWPSCDMLKRLLQRQGARQVHRADHPRRGAHLRHGRAVHARSASTPTSASSTSRSTPRR